ncbi:hypothetical protein V3C99_013621 [Haemonchus contortus]
MIHSEISNAECALEKYVKTADDLSSDIRNPSEGAIQLGWEQELRQRAITTLNVLYEELQDAEECTSNLQNMKIASIKLALIPILVTPVTVPIVVNYVGSHEQLASRANFDESRKPVQSYRKRRSR